MALPLFGRRRRRDEGRDEGMGRMVVLEAWPNVYLREFMEEMLSSPAPAEPRDYADIVNEIARQLEELGTASSMTVNALFRSNIMRLAIPLIRDAKQFLQFMITVAQDLVRQLGMSTMAQISSLSNELDRRLGTVDLERRAEEFARGMFRILKQFRKMSLVVNGAALQTAAHYAALNAPPSIRSPTGSAMFYGRETHVA